MKLFKPKKQKEPDLPLYESLEDLPLYNWNKIQEKNDLNWLRIDFDGRQKKIADARLLEVKKKLDDEYFILWDDDRFTETLQKRNEISYYIGLYEIVKANLNRMSSGIIAGLKNKEDENALSAETRLKIIKQLKQLRYVMPEINSVVGDLEEIKRLYAQNEGVKTKIQLLSDSIEADGKKVTRRLNTEIHNVVSVLGWTDSVNAKEISVADWIDMQKQAIEINKKREVKQE